MDLQRSYNLPNVVIFYLYDLPVSHLTHIFTNNPVIVGSCLFCSVSEMLLSSIETPVTSPDSNTRSHVPHTFHKHSDVVYILFFFFFLNVSLSVLSHLCCPLLVSHLFKIARRVQTECRTSLSRRGAEATHQFLWSAERSADLHYVFMFLLWAAP